MDGESIVPGDVGRERPTCQHLDPFVERIDEQTRQERAADQTRGARDERDTTLRP